jgi:thiamine pyrophosphate-dependent acetolactate synthase large subunit-like protein
MKLLVKRLLSYLPTKLPVGLTEFHAWADSIIELSGKYADEDSLKFALASMILHIDAKVASISKNYFVNNLRKVAANQVAGQVFQDIKTKQQEAQKAAEQKPAEATASQTAAQSETKETN